MTNSIHKKSDYVWYACYGSNLLEERFLCYIRGGLIPGNTRLEAGARDNTPPLRSEPYILPYRLFFSMNSAKWNGSGVAFLNGTRDLSAMTYARRYMITREQFIDVVRQENSLDAAVEISWNEDTIRMKGSEVILPCNWYGRLLFVDEEEGVPVYSFTCIPSGDEMERTRLFGAYYDVIAVGLKETWALSDDEIKSYLDPFTKI